jgi:hypothetical protein
MKLLRMKKPKLTDTKPIDTINKDLSPTLIYNDPPENPTPFPNPSIPDTSHKRVNDDEIDIDQPTYKTPRQLSPSRHTSPDREPQQQRSPPTLNIGQKRYQQFDSTQDNKKQKGQDDAALLHTTEPRLSQPITIIDSIPSSSDFPVQPPITPAFPQLFQQPETNESTSSERALDDPNQECMATETHGSKPHSMSATEPPSEPPPHVIATSTSPLMTEPVLPQSETPMTPLDTVTSGFNPHAVPTASEFPPTHPSIPTDIIEEAEPLLPQSVTFMIPPITSPDPSQTAVYQPPDSHKAPKKRNRSSKKPNPHKDQRK